MSFFAVNYLALKWQLSDRVFATRSHGGSRRRVEYEKEGASLKR